jgi:hypothetical protein
VAFVSIAQAWRRQRAAERLAEAVEGHSLERRPDRLPVVALIAMPVTIVVRR